MVWLAVLAVVMSAIGAYYYLRVLVFLFMKQPEENAPVAVPMRSGHVVAALAFAGYYVVRLGLAPEKYLNLVAQVGEAGTELDWLSFLVDAGLALTVAGIASALTTVGTGSEQGPDQDTESAERAPA